MWYLFVALYLFIGHLTYIRTLENDKYSMIEHLTIMIMFPIAWMYALYAIARTFYRMYKNKTTMDEEIEKLEKEIEKDNE